MLNEPSNASRPAAAGIKDQPAFTMSQPMVNRVEIQAHSLQEISVLDRRLLDEGLTIGHSRLSVCAASGTNRDGASLPYFIGYHIVSRSENAHWANCLRF